MQIGEVILPLVYSTVKESFTRTQLYWADNLCVHCPIKYQLYVRPSRDSWMSNYSLRQLQA